MTPTPIFSALDLTLFRHDRLGKEGGGVALYIREHWKVSLLAQSDPKYDNTPE